MFVGRNQKESRLESPRGGLIPYDASVRAHLRRVELSSPFRPFLPHLAASEASFPFPEPL
jgi:hypothetical protein